MTTNIDLINRIDFEKVLSFKRCAGGHDDQMNNLIMNSTLLSDYNEGDYQGKVATMIQLNDIGEVVIYSDYYGSCSGCDAWKDADDDEVKTMCIQLASTAKIFKDINEALIFLGQQRIEGQDFGLSDKVRKGLLENYKEVKE